MEKFFKTWLINIGSEVVNSTFEWIKENDKLLFAKLCSIVYCDASGYDMNDCLKKLNMMGEAELVDFIDSELHCFDIKSVNDICNVFHDDISDIENFFFSYCLYNRYYVTDVYSENVRNSNFDGVFEVLPKEMKVEVLSNIDETIKIGLSSIYTNQHLIGRWDLLEKQAKEQGLKNFLSYHENHG